MSIRDIKVKFIRQSKFDPHLEQTDSHFKQAIVEGGTDASTVRQLEQTDMAASNISKSSVVDEKGDGLGEISLRLMSHRQADSCEIHSGFRFRFPHLSISRHVR